MAYRNGTYIAFHANDTSDPTESDMKYYNTLRMWKVREDSDFSFINSHEKTGSVRDTSQKETLKRSLRERLNNSKNMILIIGNTTNQDTDWVPFEIEHAIDVCKIPIIAAYPGYDWILAPGQLSNLWPKALSDRIYNGTAHVIHVPFKQDPLTSAVSQFDFDHFPLGVGLGYYSREAYIGWGIINN
jgi:hypothetical protein